MVSFATRRTRPFVPRLVGPSSWGRRERRGASASFNALLSAVLTQVDNPSLDLLCGSLIALSTLDTIHPGHNIRVLVQRNLTDLGKFSQTVEVTRMSDVCQRVF